MENMTLSTDSPITTALQNACEVLTAQEFRALRDWLSRPETLAESKTMSADAVAYAISCDVAHKVAWRGEHR